MNCNRCRAACPFHSLPAGAEILRHDSFRPSTEHCGIVRVGSVVRKYVKQQRSNYTERARMAAAHPDLFAPIAFDAAERIVEQPYIDGRQPTDHERIALREEVARRQLDVSDLHEHNIRVRPDGTPVIIDFDIVPAPAPSVVRKRKWVKVEGPITPAMLAELGWGVTCR